jgi:two-component system LytT family sensor kinase
MSVSGPYEQGHGNGWVIRRPQPASAGNQRIRHPERDCECSTTGLRTLPLTVIYPLHANHSTHSAVNEISAEPSTRKSLLLRLAFIPLIATLNFAINVFGMVMTSGQARGPRPPLHRLFWVGAMPAISWVVLSIPVQFATRRLVRERVFVAVAAHIVVAAAFLITHSVLLVFMRAAAGLSNPRIPLWVEVERHVVGTLPYNLLVYVVLVAGTLAWDNWRLSIRRERTAAQLAAELTRAELSALRSKMQPHFLFNALHGISSVMETDVAKARQMMVALSQLLRASLQTGSERTTLEQEVQFTRDYLDLQHMRFEERLVYDLHVDARPHVRVPSFILQPVVENAVIHGMADRSEPTRVHVAVRELAGEVEIEVSDDGPGFPSAILDGTKPLGVGLSALRGRLRALPNGRGTMTLRNGPDGGAQVIVRVPTYDEDGPNA